MAVSDIMTPEQVAEYLQVSSATVYGCIRQGKLVAFRVGQQYRISRENLDLFLLSNATSQPGLRVYSDADVQRFLDEDRLDTETQEIAENLLRSLQSKT
jgi:excisionase family DNA binding protein